MSHLVACMRPATAADYSAWRALWDVYLVFLTSQLQTL
jgi:hypothetical protein